MINENRYFMNIEKTKKKFQFISFHQFIDELLKDFFNPLLQKIFIPDKNCQFIIAVSGGPDSIFLTYVYKILYKKNLIYEPVLFHFNHKIRKESDKEEDFVVNLARNWNLPIYVESSEVLKLAKKLNKNLEECARILRYRALFRLSKNFCNESIIVTGHHADDYIETVFLRLLRGSSLRNIQFEFKRVLPITIAKKKYFLNILSPLLLFEKSEMIDYLEKNHIPYVIDHSNFDTNFKRNNLRKNVLKPLKELGFKSGLVWQRTHLNISYFKNIEDKKDFYIIDKILLSGLGNKEIKLYLDQVTRILGILPFSSSIISELIYQSHNNIIKIITKECIIESVKDKIWFIRTDSYLLKEPYIESNLENYIIIWNHQERIYKKNDIKEVQYLLKDKDNKRKSKIKEILRVNNFSRYLRKNIPYIIHKNDKIQILLSFIEGYWDMLK